MHFHLPVSECSELIGLICLGPKKIVCKPSDILQFQENTKVMPLCSSPEIRSHYA